MKTNTERSKDRRKRLKAQGWSEIRSIEGPDYLHEEVKVLARNYIKRHTLKKDKTK